MQESLILDFIAKFNLILIEMLNNIGEIWVDLSQFMHPSYQPNSPN